MADQARPTISLCMIVKDEERHLPECLASARPYVDEIIVVDTGSGDNTVAIAKDFGARVFSFEWVHDFAAARNESLRHATGAWILQLDADERLNLLGNPEALRDAVRARQVDAYAVLIKSPFSERDPSTYATNYNLRFFRRRPGIHYEGMVHESIEPSVERAGSSIANATFLIDHLGYHIESSDMNAKLQRNLKILEQAAAKDPGNGYVFFCLGTTYRALERNADALGALNRALRHPGASNLLMAMSLNAMSSFYLAECEYGRAIDTARKSLEILPNQNTAHYHLGTAYFRQEDYVHSLPHLMSCYDYLHRPLMNKVNDLSQECTMNEWFLLKSLTVSLFYNADYSKAADVAYEYFTIDEKDYEVCYVLALSLVNTGSYEKALAYMNKAVVAGLSYQKARLPMAFCCFRMGRIRESVDHLVQGEENDSLSIAQAFNLMVLLVEQCKEVGPVESWLAAKQKLIHRGSLEQLGSVVSSLARLGHMAGLKKLFEMCRERGVELQALLRGVINFFHEQKRLCDLLFIMEGLASENPAHPTFQDACGIIHIKQGNLCRALDIYCRLHQLRPGDESVARTLAGLYVSMGNEAQALQCLKNASNQGW